MPWKLLFFILVTALALTFIGFNLGNSSDISLVFHTFGDVPVVITILASFLFGLLVAFFFTVGRLAGKGRRDSKQRLSAPAPSSAGQISQPSADASEPFKPDVPVSPPGKAKPKGRAKSPDKL